MEEEEERGRGWSYLQPCLSRWMFIVGYGHLQSSRPGTISCSKAVIGCFSMSTVLLCPCGLENSHQGQTKFQRMHVAKYALIQGSRMHQCRLVVDSGEVHKLECILPSRPYILGEFVLSSTLAKSRQVHKNVVAYFGYSKCMHCYQQEHLNHSIYLFFVCRTSTRNDVSKGLFFVCFQLFSVLSDDKSSNFWDKNSKIKK